MEKNKKNLLYLLKNPEYLLTTLILIVILLSSLTQVLNRAIPQMKAPWTLELITYLFGGLIWIGIPLAIHDDSHVGIKTIYHRFPKKVRKVLKVTHMVLFAVMLIFFGYIGSLALLSYARRGQFTPALHAPTWLMRSPLVIGTLISLYRLGEKIYQIVTDKDPEFKYDIPEGLEDLSIEELIREGFIHEPADTEGEKK